ncbi:hypothetical protein N7539_006720 [Penicillium diatomitis]|uniref:Uncharacterized protein n=1 Tax=Penicillium diatomitis TaxID=2819901 RepID=A0A9W9X2Y0_9EURO|nr:uncharacterized protein N7539_006720 [Penicillium diatomitis]KAJ5480826.1 hypothetical protein N7539_006720 [Penicillium diatomitis]
MPTPLDRALKSQLIEMPGFAGMVTAVAAWSIWGSDDWTEDELRRWLRNRNLLPNESATRDELLERVRANLRVSRRTKSPASQS